MIKDSDSYYGTISRFFHWVVAMLLIINLFIGYLLFDGNIEDIQKEIATLNSKLKYFYAYDDIETCRKIRNKINELQIQLSNELDRIQNISWNR